jgi:hypothetical protein
VGSNLLHQREAVISRLLTEEEIVEKFRGKVKKSFDEMFLEYRELKSREVVRLRMELNRTKQENQILMKMVEELRGVVEKVKEDVG